MWNPGRFRVTDAIRVTPPSEPRLPDRSQESHKGKSDTKKRLFAKTGPSFQVLSRVLEVVSNGRQLSHDFRCLLVRYAESVI